MSREFIIDGHLDLATNAMTLNRDLRKSVHELRDLEIKSKLTDYQDRGKGTVALPQLREGRVGVVLTTIISRVSETANVIDTMSLTGWRSPQQAFANAQAQLAWYREMEACGEIIQIKTFEAYQNHKAKSILNPKAEVGYILALEGADSIVNLDYLHWYYKEGLRSIGLSHFGPGRYAAGTYSDGSGLTARGFELLQEMNSLNMILDTTHLTDKGFFEVIEKYDGPVIASHQNCRAIIPGERQFSDDQLKCIIQKNGVIGGALDTWMLHTNFNMGVDSPLSLNIGLEKIIDHYDHICQLSGSSKHIAIGSDLDGLFGLEQTPYDMDSVADLQKLDNLLDKRGYSAEDKDNIFFKNWERIFSKCLTNTN